MTTGTLATLATLKQSVWLDHIDRDILMSGKLHELITQDRLAGLTSNPAIFEKAISKGGAYAEPLAQLKSNKVPVEDMYETLVLKDIADAADQFRPVYENSQARDGYVSIEVSPLLARDTQGTLEEARELWARLARPNIMIKVPGTREGIPAIRQLLAEGINVNVTLLFSVGRYLDVLHAYMEALQERLIRGQPLASVRSVASFFLSRIDVRVDAILDDIITKDNERAQQAATLRGSAAIASAAFAYQRFRETMQTEQWKVLAAHGAQSQRLLWASTGTKDPQYSDIKYVEALIAEDTINTLPLKTLDAYRDHGEPEVRIDSAIESASSVMHGLAELDIDMAGIDDQLEQEGIEKFIKPYQALLNTFTKLV